MKRINIAEIVVVAMLLAWTAGAQSINRLSVQEIAGYDATHQVIVDYEDFTESATNTAQTFTMSVPANSSVEFMAMYLETAFDVGTTNYTGSCAVTVGDGDDADLYLTSTELASDGTEVFLKLGREPFLTLSTGAVGGTNFVTNVTITATSKLYTTADTIDFKFTPNLNEALDDNTAGKVHFFLRVRDRKTIIP